MQNLICAFKFCIKKTQAHYFQTWTNRKNKNVYIKYCNDQVQKILCISVRRAIFHGHLRTAITEISVRKGSWNCVKSSSSINKDITFLCLLLHHLRPRWQHFIQNEPRLWMAVINVPHPGPFPSLKQGFAVRLRLASDSPPSHLSCVGAQDTTPHLHLATGFTFYGKPMTLIWPHCLTFSSYNTIRQLIYVKQDKII